MDLEKGLRDLLSPDLDAMFWTPLRAGKASAWWAHVPFAFWCMAACKPRLFVELGTHNGVSYAAFCEANRLSNAGARCYAVDTWEGDEHAGQYGDEVYNDLRDLHNQRYSAFSEMLRCTFDEALPRFQDGSIDLLHIDGLHTYEAVRHDFESWLPKLSDRAVVLFHDTNVLEGDFGVHRLFAELAARYPHFEFLHGYGLGVLAVGGNVPAPIEALCACADDHRASAALRDRFSHLGALWHTLAREQLGNTELHGRIAAAVQEANAAKAAVAQELDAARAAAASAEAQREALRAEIAGLEAVRDRAQERVAELRGLLTESRGNLETALATTAAASWQTSDAVADAMRSAFARRYREAFQDPSTGIKSRLKRRLLRQVARFGRLAPPIRNRALARLEFHRQADVIRQSLLFDREWYLEQYPDVARAGADPVTHYLLNGAADGRDPGPHFSTTGYLAANPDVTASGLNPLVHYVIYGEAEGRTWPKAAPASQGLPILTTQHIAMPLASAREPSLSLLYVSGEPDTPGNIYRVARYIEAAAVNGVEAKWIPQADLADHLTTVANCSVLVLWRTPWSDTIAMAIETARRSGGVVVFDVDDLMIDPSLAVTSVIDGIRSQHLTETGVREHYARVRQTMFASDICTTTTEELAHIMRDAEKPVHVLPNGFDQEAFDISRRAAREWRRARDGLVRIGYAGGSRTHQKDFGLAAAAIARVLRERPECRLVLFRTQDGRMPLIDIEEFPVLEAVQAQIEWRPLQPLTDLPKEMARFDINLAPLEFGNPFCEAKSELKFFEAALVEVPTIASPTGPFRRAIEHGRTGFLAASADDWYFHLDRLAGNAALREAVGRAALHTALARFGPRQRALQFGRFLDQLRGGATAARGFALDALLRSRPERLPRVYPSEVIFEHDTGGQAEVSVVIPLYNYEQHVVEALDSVLDQTLHPLDLVIVDGHSTDKSLAVALKWARANAARFNRLVLLKNNANYGLGLCRNSGFDAAQTPYVMLLDADNRLLPPCCELLLKAIRKSSAAYVYPTIQHFGASDRFISSAPYAPQRFVHGNYIDAMALVSKEAWAIVGGIDHVRFGWEDYDLWCRFAEHGLAGEWLPKLLAEYRVHPTSMLSTQTLASGNYRHLMENYTLRHPWVWLRDRHLARVMPMASVRPTPSDGQSRLDRLLPILRCPVTRQKLGYDETRTALRSFDGLQSWPIVEGRPALSPLLLDPEIRSPDQISNEVPREALDIIRSSPGWVLNLSAGGSLEKFENVVEVEYAIFRHTDIVADAHILPFEDASFDAAIVMNAFEHYREPRRVAAELFRVLRPGGRIHIRTAFLQPLHERPWHFYPCTRHGLEEWFAAFEVDKLHVSDNFCPNHTISWIATELEGALRTEVSAEAGERFGKATMADFVQLWTNPSGRTSPLWTDMQRIPQHTQEITAAGFELIGRKPLDLPDLKA
jgi:GT2 family glycosyltransferase/glycosyltransferase involved in cell wall biosynthesis/SAM-dependent methyltransferase/uncharacterized protein YbaR (Trm112 family)